MEKEQKKLEILVVEDSAKHQESAKVSLAEHNTTIVSTFDDAIDLLRKKAYDVLLTDLFYTQGRGVMQSDKSQAHVELPFGYPIAMIAAKKKVPCIAILTDANHHSSPMAYTIDHLFNQDDMSKSVMKMNGSKVAVLNSWGLSPLLYQTPDGRIGTKEQVGELGEVPGRMGEVDYVPPEGSVNVKNWKAALDIVTGNYKK